MIIWFVELSFFILNRDTNYLFKIEGENHVQHTDIDASRTHKGIITSPGYPGNYPNDVNYTWTLKTGNPQATIFLEISDFMIVKYRYTSNCEDYLQVGITYWLCWI